ncbi:hypothetical protein PGT21_003787 [Puccinia graminis f. sp. tritici]|uniref:superoxide dismutase n=1 Tax=Puccinia graminis f. sp. tritici TaxID=56615 RepID=A0A5B0NPF0_PUCGR|nr:hypothetical protein PGTUg99_032631 [Puccinia graminis f. sp. tritici]KAA1090512.1 hypothetical protein PGT21_003787 [Puccinia graminis f. sp. tritici]
MFSFGPRFSVQTVLCLSVLGMVQGLSLPSTVGPEGALSDPTGAVSSSTDIPSETMAMASFTGSGITAHFQFSYNPTSSTSRVNVVVTGLKDGFNNPYHIHTYSSAKYGSCTSTGPHFNPTNATAEHCDPANPTLCEVGDLSGKHGNLESRGNEFRTTYEDSSLRLSQTMDGILYRSIVIHGPNKTRLACGTIVPSGSSSDDKNVDEV